jgi:hypothetical protein
MGQPREETAALAAEFEQSPDLGLPRHAGKWVAQFGGSMGNAKRESGSHRGVYLCAVAALGLALSACGGGGGPGGSGSASTSQAAADTGAAATASSAPSSTAGAATLNWTPPTENTDGTPLTNLAGYDIHYGTESGDYTQSIPVNNPGLATYVVDNLTPGTYYFSVSAVNSAGTESPVSSEVALTVN